MTTEIFKSAGGVISGVGSVETVGREARRLGGRKVLVITDRGIKSAGLLETVTAVLRASDLRVSVFDGIEPNSETGVVQACLEAAGKAKPEVVIGLGGGSAMDVAKVTAVLLANPGPLPDYFGIDRIPAPGVPVILIPTTAGTGSEVTNICVLTDPERRVKVGIVSDHLLARCAILDPMLTVGMPPLLTATTGMDAMSHALESYTGSRGSVFTDTLCLKAIELIVANLRQAFANGENLAARQDLLNASCMAGMAFTNTQNALAHALAMTIGGRYHLPHGLLCAFIMPWVMEYNLLADPDKFVNIARALGENTDGLPRMEAARLAVKGIRGLLGDLGISCRLGDYDVPRHEIPTLAHEAVGTQQRLVSNNPRKVNVDDVVTLLEANF